MGSTGHNQVPWTVLTARFRHVAPASRFPRLSPPIVVLSVAVPLSEAERPAAGVSPVKCGAV